MKIVKEDPIINLMQDKALASDLTLNQWLGLASWIRKGDVYGPYYPSPMVVARIQNLVVNAGMITDDQFVKAIQS